MSNKSLAEIKQNMASSEPNVQIHTKLVEANNKKKPLGKFHPWAYWVEIVRGCNLACWHCATRLLPRNEFHYMARETWISFLELVKEITPYNRIEFANAGEPSLHPDLLEFIRLAKEITPYTQTQLITNGTTLISRVVKYKELFDAGLNSVYVDMYTLPEKHIKLAKESGYPFYEKDKCLKDMPNAYTYLNNPDLKIIFLVNNPSNWSRQRYSTGKLHTYLNKLDWKEAEKHGVYPTIEPPTRRCDQPSKFASLFYDGSYSFCCNDFLQQVGTNLGNVSDGTDGFLKYWLGQYMQYTRKLLHNKDRKSHELCSKCSYITARCDIPWWEPELLEKYWTGNEWKDTSKINLIEKEKIPCSGNVSMTSLDSALESQTELVRPRLKSEQLRLME